MNSDRFLKSLTLILCSLFAVNCATVAPPAGIPTETALTETATDVHPVSSIHRISMTEGQEATRVQIEATEPFAPPLDRIASNPLRIVLDFPRIEVAEVKESVKIGNETVNEVLATQYDEKGRVEIGLFQMTSYKISKGEKTVNIDIERRQKAPEAQEPNPAVPVPDKQESTVLEKAPATAPQEEKEEEPAPLSPPASGAASARVAQATGPAREILNITAEQKDDLVRFEILADGRVGNYNSFKMDSPARLVVDLLELGGQKSQRSIKVQNPYIREVRVGRHPDKLRVVFDSVKPQMGPYQINRMEDRLLVSFGNGAQAAASGVPAPEKTVEAAPPSPSKTKDLTTAIAAVADPAGGAATRSKPSASPVPPQKPTATETAAKAASAPAAPGPVRGRSVTAVEFKQLDDRSRIVIGLPEEFVFESQRMGTKMIAVDVRNVIVPKAFQRPLDTSEFDGPVTSVAIQNIRTSKGTDARVLIKLREEAPFDTIKEGRQLLIDFEKPKKSGAKAEPASKPVPAETKPEETKKEAVKAEEHKKEESQAPKSTATMEAKKEGPVPAAGEKAEPKKEEEAKKTVEEGGAERLYQGRKISLDFKDADIKNILRLIAEVSNLNVIAGEEVTGKITMRLVDVPWDQALDVVLQARSLGMTRVGNVIRVAPLDTLKKETQAELEAKRARERLEDLTTELVPVNYATAKDLIPQVKSVLSDRGDVKVDERTNILIIKDISRSIGGVKSLIKSLDTKTPQVLIEARIVEANLTFQRELGVSWGFQAVSGNIPGSQATVQGGILPFGKVVDLPAVPKVGTAGVLEFLFNSTHGLKELDIAISAHENKGDARIISSPKIATLDNKEASVEQGLRIPYLKLTTEGTVTTDFIDANLKLTVIPHVTNDGNIKLNIKVKKDAPDQTIVVQGVPSIDKKEAITEVLIRDNGVVVIAGIYTIEKSDSTEGVPLFSKIPLFGWLFKREAKEDVRKDLLIFISPKIIKDQV
jgi:type IV pilus assembly protein PilQ